MGKKQWFLLGAAGAIVGVAMKAVRGRRREDLELGRWEEPPAPAQPAREEEAPS